MAEDPLSEVLSMVRARSVIAGGFTAGGKWALRFPPPDRVKFVVVAKGECWFAIDGMNEPFRVREGETVLLTAPCSYRVASDLDAEVLDAERVFEGAGSRIVPVTEGEEYVQIGGHVVLDSEAGGLLSESLPPTVHLASGSVDTQIIKWLLDRLLTEHEKNEPGMAFATTQLAQLMFLQILRAYLNNGDGLAAGRLRAISDSRLAPALRLMHRDPAKNWHLEELAKAAAMSRTAFAVYFKSVAGRAPLTYLTEWRMRLAEHALRESDDSLLAVAASVGYASESAFSTAFKRVTGDAPKRYRNRARPLRIGKR